MDMEYLIEPQMEMRDLTVNASVVGNYVTTEWTLWQ